MCQRESAMQVLHVHGFSGAGLQCAYLLTSCYLLYVREFDLYDKAYDYLPPASHQLISGPNHQALHRYAELCTHAAVLLCWLEPHETNGSACYIITTLGIHHSQFSASTFS